jgi:hypothetical protein
MSRSGASSALQAQGTCDFEDPDNAKENAQPPPSGDVEY